MTNLSYIVIGIMLYVIAGRIMEQILCYIILGVYFALHGHTVKSTTMIVECAVMRMNNEDKYFDWQVARYLGWPIFQIDYMQHILQSEKELRAVKENIRNEEP